jgi:hypothetical protein
MPVELKPTSIIEARLGIEPDGRVQKQFTSSCAEHMDKYVPFRKGILSDYTIVDNMIVYNQIYASYQYYGQRKDGTHKINPDNRDRSKHPLATSYWDKKMVSAELKDVINEVKQKIGG